MEDWTKNEGTMLFVARIGTDMFTAANIFKDDGIRGRHSEKLYADHCSKNILEEMI